MNKYVISLAISTLSGTNTLAADWSDLGMERPDPEVSNLINSPTAEVVLNKVEQQFATVDCPESAPML
ncbi:MAG: hypothetical protein F6K47_42140, partial [Symploca sp. SIO2E6]|nr:hypothetical protein [Symploca sp. SIO2E6]